MVRHAVTAKRSHGARWLLTVIVALTLAVTVMPVAERATASGAIASDSFNRTVSNGWGNADTGGAWTLVDQAANWSVSPGAGSISVGPGSQERAYLGSLSVQDADILTKVVLPKSSQSNFCLLYIMGRYVAGATPTYYRVGVGLGGGSSNVILRAQRQDNTNLSPDLNTGIPATAGVAVWLRVEFQGTNPTTVRARAWSDGTTEPTSWLLNTTDSNAAQQIASPIGVRGRNDDTSATHTFQVQSYQASTIAPPTPVPTTTPGTATTLASDSFSRTASNGWSSADTGGLWTTVGTPSNWSVSAGAGNIAVGANAEERAYLSKVNTQDVDIVTKVVLPKSTQSNNTWFYVQGRYTAAYSPTYYEVGVGQGAGGGTVVLGGLRSDGVALGTNVSTGISAVDGAVVWLHVKFQGTNPTTVQARVWADGTAEPTTWQLNTTDSNSVEQGAGQVGLDALNQDTAASHTYLIESYQATGVAVPPTPIPPNPSDGTAHHFMYVFPDGEMDVYDMDNGHRLFKRISLPTVNGKGAIVDAAGHMLYLAECGPNCAWTSGAIVKYDLLTDTIVWIANYQIGLDGLALTRDGKTIYVANGEGNTTGLIHTVDATTGAVTGSIRVDVGAHNIIMGLSGTRVYTGGFQNAPNYKYLMAVDTSTNTISQKIGPFNNSVGRPFTINGNETIVYTTENNYLGFEVASLTTGKVLYTVPVSGFTWSTFVTGAPSHGISMSPDEKELYLIDGPNDYVHVFDITGVPNSAPKQIADIKLSSIAGLESPCSSACDREGWLLHSRDGRYVYVGDTGDVINTATRTIVANLPPLTQTRKLLEIDWQNGVPFFSTSRYGLGYVTGTQSTNTPTPTATGTPSTSTPIPTAIPTQTQTSSTTLFSDNFESDQIGSVPSGWSVAQGTWSVTQGTGSNTSKVVTESGTGCHCYELVAGSSSWTDYTVQADMQAAANSTGMGLAARRQDVNNNYQLVLKNGNQWYIGKIVAGTWTTFAQGTFAYTVGNWYTLALTVTGTTISGSINGTQLASASDSTFSSGTFSLHTSVAVSFDNIVVTTPGNAPTPSTTNTPAPTATYTVVATPTNTPVTTTLLSDNFEADTVGSAPANWTVAGGSWTVQSGTGSDTTQVVSQTNSTITSTVELAAGSSSWTDYTVQADVQAPAGGNSFGLAARRTDANNSYQFILKNGNQWYLGGRQAGTWFTLAQGTFTYSTGTWYTLVLKVSGTTISGSINGTQVASATDSRFSSGAFSLRTSATPSYDNVIVTSP